jgi:hypothetical protein
MSLKAEQQSRAFDQVLPMRCADQRIKFQNDNIKSSLTAHKV